MFNCADIIKNLLGYSDFKDCSQWRSIKDNPKFVLVDLTSGSNRKYFTGRGALEIIFLSKRKNAEIIKDWIYELME